jgi:hypothetical protein
MVGFRSHAWWQLMVPQFPIFLRLQLSHLTAALDCLGLAAGLVLLVPAVVFSAPFLAAGFCTSNALPLASAASAAAPLAGASLPGVLPLPVADRSRKSSSFGSAACTQAAPNKPHSQGVSMRRGNTAAHTRGRDDVHAPRKRRWECAA